MKTRRDFLKLSLGGVSALTLPTGLFAEETSFDDYKALVVIYHSGGNDGLNMFIPSGDDPKTGYDNYAKIRDTIGVQNNPLSLSVSDGKLDLTGGNPYSSNNSLEEGYRKGFYTHDSLNIATNPLMPEVAHLMNSGKVAVIANCGNLIEPATKAEFKAKTKQLPPFLFAHNHQTRLAMNGEASLLDYTGWAGRLADRWIGVNGGDVYGLNIAIGRTEHIFYGDKTTPLSIRAKGPTSYDRINRGIYNSMLNLNYSNIYKEYYQELQSHSFLMQDIIVDDWNNKAPTFSSLNAYGGALFSYPSNSTLSQKKPTLTDGSMLENLKAVAKLAHIGKSRGLKRQIFFIFDGGYDTHSNQIQQHSKKLRGLSLGLGDFYRALEEMGMEDMVTTFNISDFGRSTGNNGDGTDHAWGGYYFALGGAVKGGLYGTLPDLTLGSDDDLYSKGRLIPTTSMSQYYNTILKWYGVDSDTMQYILPEINNFDVKDLGFMA